jgi:hypothetical protein
MKVRIEEIRPKNYRAFENARRRLGISTFLVGRNGAGKYRETVHQKHFANLVSSPLRAPMRRRSPTYKGMFDAVHTLSAPAGFYVVAR